MLSHSIPGKGPEFTQNVAPGVHRLAHAYVNCYLVQDGAAVTVVDAAFPRTWPYLMLSLKKLGLDASSIKALVLTHAHFDHLGFAAQLARELSVPIWLRTEDQHIAEHPYRYRHERNRLLYPLLYPRSLPVLGAMMRAGALNVEGVPHIHPLGAGELDVPGSPLIIPTPGHTDGHCVLHFPDKDAVIVGDALVPLDPYKAAQGPQIIAGAATADSAQALASLTAIAQTNAGTVLPGHGEPWHSGAGAAVAAATSVGSS